tara:strand:+ start:284 stop:832 length:549 start_codon:yes stop_codon:yes gene_type:complete
MKQFLLAIIITFFTIPSFSQVFSEKELLQKLNADLIVMDAINGDGVFKARNVTTKKWGMFQYGTEIIPMKYDSLEFFTVNGKYTIVYNNGKLGTYLSYFDYEKDAKQTVPCLYDNYKKIKIPYNGENRFPPITYTEEYLAVKKNGKWGWVNWFTGAEQSKFIYNTIEDLPTPDYIQEWINQK